MNRFILPLLLAASVTVAVAQTASKPTTPATPAPPTSSTASAASTAATPVEPWVKLPPGVPAVAHGPIKTIPVIVRYEDVKIGAGALGESGKAWHLKYTGWLAATGVKFDAWDEHQKPVMGKDGKPELGPDGKPTMEEPQPIVLPQGIGAVIPGFDYGLAGMKIGGQRRIFIPWQLAYGTRAIPDRPGHPGIPPKSDLIFDVELVGVTDMPESAPHPTGMSPHHPGVPPAAAPAHPEHGSGAESNGAPAAAPAQPPTSAQPATSAPSTAPEASPAPASAPAEPQPK